MRADDFLDGFERPSADEFLDGLSAKPGKKSPGFQLPGVMDPLGINKAPSEPRISVLQGESAPFDFRRASAAKRAIEDMPKTGGRRGPQSLTQAPSVDQGFMENAARVLRRAVDSINQGTSGIVRNVGDITGIDAVSDFAKASSNASRRFANQTVAPQVSIDGFTPGSIVQDLPEASENALVSIGTQAPALATGSVPAALAIMFGQSYGDSYNTARDKGLSALAAMGNATGNAGFEVIGERFGGTPGTIRALKGAIAGNEPAQVAAELAKAGLRDIPGELVTYGGQTAVNAAPVVGIGPAPTVDEFLEGAKDTVLQTIIQGGVMQGAGTGLAAARRAAGNVPQIDMRAGIDAIMGRQAEPVAPPTMPTTPEASAQSVEPVAPAAPATPPAPDMVEGIVSAIQAAAEAAVPNPRTPAATPAVEQSADDFLDQAARQPQQPVQPAPIEPTNEQPAAAPDQTSVQAPDQAPAPAGQAAPSGAADTVGGTDAPAAQPQPEQQAALSPDTRLGVDGIELSQGGQPYTSKTEAQRARKLQPDLRLVKVAGGYALAPKTAAQQAAYAKAARRLGSTGNKGMPMSVHEFLASRGGLSKGTMSDLGFDRNMRIGARWLFARNGGMSFEQAAEALQQAGYTQESDLAKVINLIQRSARYQPQYTPEGFEQLAELERERDYQDYLEAQQEVGDDPFAPLEDMGFTEEDAQAAGFYQASPELQAEVAALAAQLEDIGQDAEAIMERIALQYPEVTQQEYYERARQAITEAITQAAEPRGRGDAGQDDGSQAGQGAGQQTQGAEPEGLTSYTREDIERRQDQQAQAQRQAEQQRLDQERRAQADAQVDDFVLTGSDRDADVAAARGQGGLFDQPAESPQLKAVLDQLSAMGDAVAGMREALTNGVQSAAGQSQAAKKANANPQPTDAKGPLPIPQSAFEDLLEEATGMGDLFEPATRVTRIEDAATEVMTADEAQAQVQAWKDNAKEQGKTGRNANKVVLSLFDASGQWSKPWREAGYQVYTFDLQNGDDINQFNAEFLLDQFGDADVHAILAAPPCTDFSSSGAHAWSKKDADGRTEASIELVRQTLRTVELMKPKVWALENPVGRIGKLTGLATPRLSFQPHNFGDPYTKRTLLWGSFDTNLPTANVEPTEGSKVAKLSGTDKYGRSLTPEGFAYAFFQANNAADMGEAAELARTYRGIPQRAIQEALDAGMTPEDVSYVVADAYYDGDTEGATELLREATQERGGSTEVNEEVKPYGDEGKRVLQREPGNLLPREQKAFDDFLATRSPADARRIRDNLAKHKGTPWAKQAVEGIFVRQAMRLLMQGKTPDFQSSMDSANVANVRKTLLERGIDGAWARVELDGGLMGAAAKPVNNVNSSFINCDPSADCAKYCYATSGNYRYANTIVKSELVTLLVEMDPVRAARRVAAEYKATGEFMMNKALRLFDKGDGNESWLPFIKELNRQGVRAHIFSKNPQFLRQVPEQNLRLLSIDDSNLELADQNQDLPVAFVYSGRDQLEALARLSARDQIQVVLPVKVGQRVLDGSEILDIKQSVPEVKPYLCPIDSGFKKLGKPGQQGTWNCTSCDKNGGIGCFHGTPTKAIMESAEVKPVPQQVKAQRILELKRKINEITAAPGGNLAEAGRVRPGQLEGLLSEVDALLGDLLRGYDGAGEGQAAGRPGPGADQAGDGSRGPVSRRRVIPIRAARADASGRRDGGNDELSEPPRAEAPRGRYTDDRQLQLFVDNGPVESQAGPAAEAAQRDAVSAVDDLRSTGNVLALALSRDYAARQRVNLVGQQVKTPEDLAILAQVYRDPRFETFRVFFTNDAGQVVSQVGLTSRLPASTQAIMGDDMDAYLAELSGIARNRGATGYYLLHNHPSGQATPSRADLVLTRAFAEKMPMLTFKSHVVIDTNEFSTIDRNGKPQKFQKDFGQPAPFRDQEWVDVQFTGPDDLMSMARRLQVDDDAITLIHTDNQYNVKAISTIPNAASFLSKDELKKQVVKASLQVRGAQLFAVSRDDLSLYRIGSMVVDAIHVKDSGQVVSLRANGAIGGGTPLPEKRRTRLSPDSSPEFGYLRKRYLPMSQKEAGRRVAEPGARFDQVDTSAFRRWFGDSKVVDADGKPLVVYHGTTSDIEKFQSKAAMTGWDLQNNGIYFTADPGYADAYARGKGSEQGNREGSNIVPVYLSIQNPLVIEPNESDFDKRFSSSYYSPDAVRELKAQGYDGVINYALDEFVVFDATQVKSAIGNNGQFDPANPSIVRDDDGQYQVGSRRQPGRSLNPFGRDQLGRVKFKAGEAALAKFGQVIKPVLDKTGMTMASPELRRQLRAMKTTIEEANRNAAEVAKQMAGLSEADRILVSDIVEKSLKTGVVPPDHAVKIADAISKAMDRQTDELIELGMLTPASAERWRGRYLPRLYLKGTPSEDASFWRRLFKLDGTLRGIRGDNLKARGLFETVSVDEAEQWLRLGFELRDQHWRLKQGKLELVDKNAPVAAREKVVVWRDWTESEREKMGEIRDAMLRYVEGYTAMQRDIALGRLFNNIASNTEWVRRSPSAGWIRVPDTEIPNTAGVKRYGNLAGLYVKQDVMTHLTQFEEAANDSLQLWREALGLWKEGKTALNPVAHFNNVMSNISMAHFAGVSYWDGHKYLAAVRDLVKGDDKVEAARKAGLFTGSFTKEELAQSMPPELQKLMNLPEGAARKAGRQVMNAITLWLRQPMRAAYEAEDTFFKYLIWRDARQRGMSDEEAADYALRYIFTYDDLPAGARKVRDFAIPFFAWTYKAIPALLHTAMVYPWRFLAPAAALHGINLAAYALAAGDEDDDWMEKIAKGRELEAEEREVLPDRMKGLSALGNPKHVRLGTDSLTGNPIYLDVSRVIPGGDMFDMENQAGGLPIPAPLMPNHPVLTVFSAMVVNKEMWMGKEVVDENDTAGEAAAKRARWMAGFLLPAVSPGGYHSQRILDATAAAADTVISTPLGDFTGIDRGGQPVQPKYAAMQTVGIKARPIDLELEGDRRRADDSRLAKSIAAEVRSLARLHQRGAISDRAFEEGTERAREKMDRMRE